VRLAISDRLSAEVNVTLATKFIGKTHCCNVFWFSLAPCTKRVIFNPTTNKWRNKTNYQRQKLEYTYMYRILLASVLHSNNCCFCRWIACNKCLEQVFCQVLVLALQNRRRWHDGMVFSIAIHPSKSMTRRGKVTAIAHRTHFEQFFLSRSLYVILYFLIF
jgi:hypothetical protein